ncbi:MAG: hypothetical protein A2086_05575 [Spirochaetes bacterium GWD1_27_9]|nr:MAG: hypothetical protein A2Z98_16595 [Spirochaetes bacterium GWB1_27_13]OHD24319.1 MAG: hypothetical protein A2Y34_05260 [Spirochaetes bacterium GWC1_27_15]OHD37841.1 MAG: hypothetical protein A2086_05575 [Spirochaetes bacterium GWD1_27_9]
MKTILEIEKELSTLEEKLKNVVGTETEVYTRIVGYHRAVTNWNKGKKEEYRDRLTFSYFEKEIEGKSFDGFIKGHKEESVKEENIVVGNVAFYKLFYTEFCRNCPPVKEFLKKLPVPGEEVDVSSDLGLNSARKYNILSTPTVVLFDSKDNVISIVTSVEELKKIFAENKELISA